MAKSKSTRIQARKSSSAQPMIIEEDLRPPTAAERRKGLKAIKALGLLQGNTPVNFYDLLNELLDVKGAIRLSQEAISKARDLMSDEGEKICTRELLEATDGVLSIALRALDQAYEHIDVPAIRDAWPTSPEEVTHG
jgi:hypothetical protein